MILFPIEKIVPECSAFGLELDKQAIDRLNLYGNILLEWNEKINLTAITEPEEVVRKHFYDCLLFFKHNTIPMGAKIVDVGTGAGFPGIVLKIARPDIELTLLDSLSKRVNFLKEVIKKLELSADAVHIRAEEAGKSPLYREKYDIATARAVARLNVLAEYCLPFVKPTGFFVAMKGPAANEELSDAKKAISLLGGQVEDIICERLAENEERCFVKIKKISQTPTKYPRISAKISKQPL